MSYLTCPIYLTEEGRICKKECIKVRASIKEHVAPCEQ
jgi:hypothetical protein